MGVTIPITARYTVTGPSVLRLGPTSCWLPQSPTVGRDGRVTIPGDITFVMNNFDWLVAFLQGTAMPKDGEIVAYDYKYIPLRRYAFSRALITSLTFPTLDAAAKEQAKLMVTMQLTGLTQSPATGKPAVQTLLKQNSWQRSNFKVAAGKFDGSRVSYVNALNFSANTLPELKIRMASAYANSLQTWFQSFVISGQSTKSAEDSVSLSYLSATFSKLFSLDLRGVGIYKLTQSPLEASQDKIASVEASFYVSGVSLRKG